MATGEHNLRSIDPLADAPLPDVVKAIRAGEYGRHWHRIEHFLLLKSADALASLRQARDPDTRAMAQGADLMMVDILNDLGVDSLDGT